MVVLGKLWPVVAVVVLEVAALEEEVQQMAPWGAPAVLSPHPVRAAMA